MKEENIISVEMMLRAMDMCLIGTSLRRAMDAISHLCKRSHGAARELVQKIGGYERKTLKKVNRDLPRVLVADEAELHVGGGLFTSRWALDPATMVVFHLALPVGRNILLAKSFLLGIKARYGRLPTLLIRDGGVWYPAVCRQLGVRHEWLVGGVRSQVGRWNETLKDQGKLFDGYYPWSGTCGYGHVLNWCFLSAFHCDHVRRHMSRGNRLPLGNRRGMGGSD